MASQKIVKISKLDKNTKEAKEIRMFQNYSLCFGKFHTQVAKLFGCSTNEIKLFWKGK